MPARLSGSEAAIRSGVSSGFLLNARSKSIASGLANCSPRKPETNRPPRISPRASSRRRTIKQVPPCGGQDLTCEKVAEDDSPSAQQLPRERFMPLVQRFRWIPLSA